MNKEEKEAIAHLIDMSNLSLIGDGTVIIQNETIETILNLIQKQEKIIDNAIKEVEKIRCYFSEDVQVEFIRVLEILKDKNVKDW